jgi:hypothetical protein
MSASTPSPARLALRDAGFDRAFVDFHQAQDRLSGPGPRKGADLDTKMRADAAMRELDGLLQATPCTEWPRCSTLTQADGARETTFHGVLVPVDYGLAACGQCGGDQSLFLPKEPNPVSFVCWQCDASEQDIGSADVSSDEKEEAA